MGDAGEEGSRVGFLGVEGWLCGGNGSVFGVSDCEVHCWGKRKLRHDLESIR